MTYGRRALDGSPLDDPDEAPLVWMSCSICGLTWDKRRRRSCECEIAHPEYWTVDSADTGSRRPKRREDLAVGDEFDLVSGGGVHRAMRVEATGLGPYSNDAYVDLRSVFNVGDPILVYLRDLPEKVMVYR